MKIPASLRQPYEDLVPTLERLESYVRPRAEGIAQRYGGSYAGRIKELESILLKAEKEGYEHPFTEMKDLFACSIIVPSQKSIRCVKEEVESQFVCVECVSRERGPEWFDYDDLSLYLRIKPDFSTTNEEYVNLTFELQIKTLLQKAWSQASHDVIYKTQRQTWGLKRIASQLRALLEMADSVLANLEGASNVLQESVEYSRYSKINAIADMLEKNWDGSQLPSDRRRAALVIENYLELSGLTLENLVQIIGQAHYMPYVRAKSLTPTQSILIIVFKERWGDMQGRLRHKKLHISAEMLDLCPELSRVPKANRMDFTALPISQRAV